MAGRSFLLGLITGLLAFPSYTTADVAITDIFTVQDGSRDGGCDGRMAVLDQWLSESLFSVATALESLDKYDQLPKVRKAMSIFFGISGIGKLEPEPESDDSDQEGAPRRAAFNSVKSKFESRDNNFSFLFFQ